MQLGKLLYQTYNEWRVKLLDRLEVIGDDYLRVLAGELRQTIARIEMEQQRRQALKN